MKNLTRQFRRMMADDERNFLAYADITLSNNTVINLTNSELWSGGFSYEEAVSEDENFTAVGSVIIGSAEIIINNIYEEYSEYDFTNADVVLYLGMQLEDRLEKFKIGTYRVDDTTYNGATIKLSLLDNIEQFDRPYSLSNLRYPATLFQIIQDACTTCRVTLANNSLTFPHYNYSIPLRPDDESTTFRQVLSWCATIAGQFIKCNPDGELTLGWFDTTLLDDSANDLDGGTFNPWSSGTTYDGGTFNPWSDGTVYDGGNFSDDRNVHYIAKLWSQNIAMDDVVITGVTAYVKDESEIASRDIKPYSTGTDGYVIEISDNDFITTTNAQEIVNWLGVQLIGLRFRKLNVSQLSDPAIESGDVGIVVDRKSNVYRALITRVAFSIGGDQTIICGASTPSRNNATKYSSVTKSYVESRKWIKQEQSAREQAVEKLERAIEESSGLYTTIVTPQTGGNIYYLHDAPDLADAKVVWKMTKDAWAVTNDWQGTDAATTAAHKWNAGLTVDGTLITAILSAVGINADWINTGSLTGQTINGGTINGSTINAGGNGTYNSGLYARDNSNTLLVQFTRYVAKICGFNIDNASFYNGKTYVGDTSTSGCILSKSGLEVGNGISNFSVNNLGYVNIRNSRSTITDTGTTGGYWEMPLLLTSGNTTYTNTGISSRSAVFGGTVIVNGSLSVWGDNKNRVVRTKNYGPIGMNAFETSNSHFADIGSGIIGNDNIVTIFFDPIFAETIDITIDYQVLITATSEKKTDWVEKHTGYFIVHGEVDATFDWMIIGYQLGHTLNRMEQVEDINDINGYEAPLVNDDNASLFNLKEDTTDIDIVEQSIKEFNNELEVVNL